MPSQRNYYRASEEDRACFELTLRAGAASTRGDSFWRLFDDELKSVNRTVTRACTLGGFELPMTRRGLVRFANRNAPPDVREKVLGFASLWHLGLAIDMERDAGRRSDARGLARWADLRRRERMPATPIEQFLGAALSYRGGGDAAEQSSALTRLRVLTRGVGAPIDDVTMLGVSSILGVNATRVRDEEIVEEARLYVRNLILDAVPDAAVFFPEVVMRSLDSGWTVSRTAAARDLLLQPRHDGRQKIRVDRTVSFGTQLNRFDAIEALGRSGTLSYSRYLEAVRRGDADVSKPVRLDDLPAFEPPAFPSGRVPSTGERYILAKLGRSWEQGEAQAKAVQETLRELDSIVTAAPLPVSATSEDVASVAKSAAPLSTGEAATSDLLTFLETGRTTEFGIYRRRYFRRPAPPRAPLAAGRSAQVEPETQPDATARQEPARSTSRRRRGGAARRDPVGDSPPPASSTAGVVDGGAPPMPSNEPPPPVSPTPVNPTAERRPPRTLGRGV